MTVYLLLLRYQQLEKIYLDQLANEYPIIQQYRSIIRLAVNESYVQESFKLEEGDIVALITPVSGG